MHKIIHMFQKKRKRKIQQFQIFHKNIVYLLEKKNASFYTYFILHILPKYLTLNILYTDVQ
jgi:hypothetical protein